MSLPAWKRREKLSTRVTHLPVLWPIPKEQYTLLNTNNHYYAMQCWQCSVFCNSNNTQVHLLSTFTELYITDLCTFSVGTNT